MSLPALAALALCGCSPDSGDRADATAAGPTSSARSAATAAAGRYDHDAIAWFDGSVDAALARAAQDRKPVFLYWGAEWCPPCHEVKATVFRSREFIERSELFVPVYLDGDTDNAQAIGERYGVLGYPTMIVLSADGEEITRIPGGSDVQAYADVLDLALGDVGSAARLLDRVLGTPDAMLAPTECRLLAQYSWSQDTGLLDSAGRAQSFEAMLRACPASERQARSRLQMAALTATIDELGDDDVLSETLRGEATAQVQAMLDDPALVRANMHTVLFDGATIVAALTDSDSSARERLTAQWLAVLDAIAADDRVFMTERLYARYGKLEFERLRDPRAAPSAALAAEIVAAVEAADAATTDPYERQSVINTARNVLVSADLKEQAKALLLKEIGISRQPYYFMVGLADIEQDAGNFADAIGWLRRAWDDARGPATRFQWGTYYVTGLIEMAPQEVGLIESAALTLLEELGQSNAFYQRPKRQLESLERRLLAWNDSPRTAAAIDRIRSRARGVCSRLPQGASSRVTCEAFLADAGAGAGSGRS